MSRLQFAAFLLATFAAWLAFALFAYFEGI